MKHLPALLIFLIAVCTSHLPRASILGLPSRPRTRLWLCPEGRLLERAAVRLPPGVPTDARTKRQMPRAAPRSRHFARGSPRPSAAPRTRVGGKRTAISRADPRAAAAYPSARSSSSRWALGSRRWVIVPPGDASCPRPPPARHYRAALRRSVTAAFSPGVSAMSRRAERGGAARLSRATASRPPHRLPPPHRRLPASRLIPPSALLAAVSRLTAAARLSPPASRPPRHCYD